MDRKVFLKTTAAVTTGLVSNPVVRGFSNTAVSSSGDIFPYGELEIRGTKGNLYASERGYRIIPSTKGQFQSWNSPIKAEEFENPNPELGDGSSSDSTSGLIRNFLDCIKDRQSPFCTLEEGHRLYFICSSCQYCFSD